MIGFKHQVKRLREGQNLQRVVNFELILDSN